MGGGKDIDETFQWHLIRGGDFTIVRAIRDDDYEPCIAKLRHENSVATPIIPNREDAVDPAVAEIQWHHDWVANGMGDPAEQ